MHRERITLSLMVCLVVSLVGCGQDSGPALGKVSGTVTLGGQPLPDAMVSFYPTSGERSAHGMTDAAGHYTLMFTGLKEGAIVGPHSVKVETGVQVGEEEVTPAAKVVQLPAKYNKNTELTAEVEGGSNTFDFDLQ
ncbi:carboxypeptidase-like regulatory domain-containing protein [Rosistilla carotiformis]|nr:carboxypeptidase-like regulatory domain-containing protein [Rosistilla carotiformis]